MSFTDDDLTALRLLVREEVQSETRLSALRLLVREEVQAEIQPFRDDVAQRFDQVATQIDGLYKRDEKREQEYLLIREQLRRLESRFA
jgi:predicted nuclease with TOPRIM domain